MLIASKKIKNKTNNKKDLVMPENNRQNVAYYKKGMATLATLATATSAPAPATTGGASADVTGSRPSWSRKMVNRVVAVPTQFNNGIFKGLISRREAEDIRRAIGIPLTAVKATWF